MQPTHWLGDGLEALLVWGSPPGRGVRLDTITVNTCIEPSMRLEGSEECKAALPDHEEDWLRPCCLEHDVALVPVLPLLFPLLDLYRAAASKLWYGEGK